MPAFFTALAMLSVAAAVPPMGGPPPGGPPPSQGRYAADPATTTRALVNERTSPQQHGRMLPGAKSSTPPAASPVSCSGYWGSWSACSATSGGACPSTSGTQSRSYTVTRYPSGGGTACPASPQSQSCTVSRNCAGSWSDYTTCAADGQQTRSYTVTCAAAGGGTSCQAANGAMESRACVPATNCVGAWGNWGTCSAGGKQTSTYTITSYQSGGGSSCEAANGQTKEQTCTPPAVNCVGSWGSWSTCSGADSKQSSTYTTTTAKSGSGTDCEATNGQTKEQTCTPSATASDQTTATAVNCVGSWDSWSTCGSNSKQTSTYTVTTAKAGTGTDCEATNGQTKEQACTAPAAAATTTTASASSISQSVSGSTKVTGAVNAASVTPAMKQAIKTQIASYLDGITADDVEVKVMDVTAGEGSQRRRRRRLLSSSAAGVIIKYTVKVADAAATQGVASQLETATKANLATDLITKVGGTFAALAADAVTVFTPSASRTVDASWTSAGPGVGKHEYGLISCPLGSTVLLTWTNTGAVQDDVYLLGSEEAYLTCDATAAGGYKVMSAAQEGTFTFPCATAGTHFLASLAGDRCNTVRQRVRIQVTDPAQTESLRATLNPKTNVNHYSLMKIMEDDIIPIVNNGIPSAARADQILQHLWCAEPHSPAACADWIPPAINTNATCLAWINTDIGFMLRKRPGNPDLAAAEDYYKRALALVPKYCPGESYYTELLVQRGDEAAALLQFDKACAACGAASLDVLDAQSIFQAKGWAVPPCPRLATTTQFQTGKGGVPVSGLPTKLSAAGRAAPQLGPVELAAAAVAFAVVEWGQV